MLLQDYAGIVEKAELADRVKQAAAQGPQGQEAVPPGYIYDPSSGAHALIATCAVLDSWRAQAVTHFNCASARSVKLGTSWALLCPLCC